MLESGSFPRPWELGEWDYRSSFHGLAPQARNFSQPSQGVFQQPKSCRPYIVAELEEVVPKFSSKEGLWAMYLYVIRWQGALRILPVAVSARIRKLEVERSAPRNEREQLLRPPAQQNLGYKAFNTRR